MKRVDSDGFAPGNLYTNGDPQSSIPATLIEQSMLNAFMLEIVNAVEFSGQTIAQPATAGDPSTDLEQLRKAIEIIALGGSGLTNITKTIDNNQSGTSLGAELLFNKLNHTSAKFFYQIHRQSDTASSEVDEVGEVQVMYRPVQDDWILYRERNFEDNSGVDFFIDATGQIAYDSTDITGTNYAGELKISRVERINA